MTELNVEYDTHKKITADAVLELKMPSIHSTTPADANQLKTNLSTLVFTGKVDYEEGKSVYGRFDYGNEDLPMLTGLVRLSKLYIEVTSNLNASSTEPVEYKVGATMHLGKEEQLTLETTAEFPSSYGRNVLKATANAVKLTDLAEEGQLSEQLSNIELINCEIELDWDPDNFADTYKLRVAGVS